MTMTLKQAREILAHAGVDPATQLIRSVKTLRATRENGVPELSLREARDLADELRAEVQPDSAAPTVGDPVWWHDPDEPPQHERRAGVVVRVSRQGRSVDVEWFDGLGGVSRTRPERLSRRIRTNGV